MRCPDCNKFAQMELADPEIDEIDMDGETVRARVRLVRSCADCGTELKAADLELECEPDFGEHAEEVREASEHELVIKEERVDSIEEGGGRYKKSYFGASVTGKVYCETCKVEVTDFEMSDKVAASEMEEVA